MLLISSKLLALKLFALKYQFLKILEILLNLYFKILNSFKALK